MIDYLWHSLWAWIGVGGIAIIICVVIAWFIPGLRLLMLEIGGGIIAAAALLAKGAADQARRDKAKQEAAERKAVETGKAERAKAEVEAAKGVDDGYNRD